MRLYQLALAAAILAGAPLAGASEPERIPVGAGPCGVAVGFGHVWVASDRAGTVTRIDPRTNRVRTIRVGRGGCWLTAGAGAVWIARYSSGTLVRIDPRTLRVRRLQVGPNPEDVAVAAGSVWVTTFDDGMLIRVDPVRMTVSGRIRLGGNPAGLAVLGGSLWVGFGRELTAVARFDPRTGDLRRVQIGHKTPDRLWSDGKTLWISSVDTLSRVVPRYGSGEVVARFRLGSTLGRGAAGPDGMIWIPNKERDVIVRVDPRTNQVAGTISGGPGVIAVAAGFRSVWATSYLGSDVRRYRVR